MSKQRRTQGERSETTRTALLDAARALFVERGYRDVSANEIVALAGVTRGALYHHFPAGKLDLFAALLERLEVELDGAIRARVQRAFAEPGADPIRAALLGLDLYFDLVGDPGVARMMLVDASALLEPTRWRGIDAKWGIRQFGDLIAAFVRLGIYEPQPIEPLAAMLHGAAVESALYLADADDKAGARRLAHDAWYRLLLGLASQSVRAGGDGRWPAAEDRAENTTPSLDAQAMMSTGEST